MSTCSSPTARSSTPPSPYLFGESKECREAFQLHFITIPLISALHRATAPGDRSSWHSQRSSSPRLSPTPSLLSESDRRDESPPSRDEAVLARCAKSSEPPAKMHLKAKRKYPYPSRRPTHRMGTRSQASRRGTFWELDESGRKRRSCR